MPKVKITVLVLLSVAVLALSFGSGFNLAIRSHAGFNTGLDVVAQAWNIIFTDYVEPDKLDAGKLSQAAIKGIVTELDDPHTSYISPQDYQLGVSSLEGKIEGIGAQVTIKDKQIVIIAPITGSPAAEAGIRPGDVILEIDGKSTADMGLAEAVLAIRGTKGTAVKLLIRHEGETEPVSIEVVRAEIELPSVHFEMKGDIAYINISYFSATTDSELSNVLEDMNQKAATGIILDLRSNPGGVLDAVVEVASHFLKEGVVVQVRDNEGTITNRNVIPGKLITDLPMIALVDKYSASGSEVLAGALQDYSRATIAGTTTYGKGSVNIMRMLKDGSGLYITISRWLTPQGNLIEGKGLEPDAELTLTGEDATKWAIDRLHRQQ